MKLRPLLNGGLFYALNLKTKHRPSIKHLKNKENNRNQSFLPRANSKAFVENMKVGFEVFEKTNEGNKTNDKHTNA